MTDNPEKIDEKDLRMDVYSDGSKEVTVRLTHLPTGTVVCASGWSRWRLKQDLIKLLESKLTANRGPG